MSDQDDNHDFEKIRVKWEFFKLHANQRVTFFRFFIGLVVALFIAYFYILDHLQDCHGTRFLHICLLFTGIGISAISYMFYSLDLRNFELISNAKNALPEILDLSKNDARLYNTHRQIFKCAFYVTICLGILLFSLGCFKYGYDLSRYESTACLSTDKELKCNCQCGSKFESSVPSTASKKDTDTCNTSPPTKPNNTELEMHFPLPN
jgi:hypothetical protein